MPEGSPFPPPPDAPPPPPPPPPPPGSPPGTGDDSPGAQPPERRLVRAATQPLSPFRRLVKDAAALALDALDFAGDRVAEAVRGDKRPPGR